MFELYTLNNGLKIVTEYVDHINSISIGVMIKNGSRHESFSQNGISHFVEHMFFKGTNKRSAKDIVEEIENIGGQINAYTSKESTCYYVKALSEDTELCIDVLSDMILNSKFDEEDIEKEKLVILEEIDMSEDTPEDVLDDIHSKAIFGDSSLAYPILGTKEKIISFNSKSLKDYVKKNYLPNNSVITVCGKFDKVEMRKFIENYFGEWEKNDDYKVEHSKIILQNNSLYKNKSIEQLHINLGLNGIEYTNEKILPITLLNNIFGGGASSILFQKVREELGLCYSIYSYPQQYLGVGIFNIYVGLNKNSAELGLSVIKKELDEFSKFELSKSDLDINKQKSKAAYILGLESISSKMFANARSVLFRNKIVTQEDIISKINKIDMNDINYVLERCFKPGIISSAYVGNDVEFEKLNNILKQ